MTQGAAVSCVCWVRQCSSIAKPVPQPLWLPGVLIRRGPIDRHFQCGSLSHWPRRTARATARRHSRSRLFRKAARTPVSVSFTQRLPYRHGVPWCARLRRDLDAALASIALLEAQVRELLARRRRNSSSVRTRLRANSVAFWSRVAPAQDSKATPFANVLTLYPALWLFTAIEGVEPTNNHAERLLRMGVLWRKNAFGCHSAAGCQFVERMLTVVKRCGCRNGRCRNTGIVRSWRIGLVFPLRNYWAKLGTERLR